MYIGKNDQKELVELFKEYKTYYLENNQKKVNFIAKKIFYHCDKIINGLIYSKKYHFYMYVEPDDLLQDARIAIIKAIINEDFNEDKGNIFNFISTVISNALKNVITRENKKHNKFNKVDYTNMSNVLYYHENIDDKIFVDHIFNNLKDLFKDHKTNYDITVLLEKYYSINKGCGKIKKKEFIDFGKAYGFSPININSFFYKIKKINMNNEIEGILHE